jgi:hypothetical protein
MSLFMLHKGSLLECKVCSPQPQQESEKRTKRSRVTTVDIHLRRLVQADIGEDEVPKEQRFQLLEKYGVTAPRIDRRVKKPSWMGDFRPVTTPVGTSTPRTSRPWSQTPPKKYSRVPRYQPQNRPN